MSDPLRQLAARIRADLPEIERVVDRTEEAWRRAQDSTDDFYVDSAALNLNGFYGGIERIFERIAAVVDSNKPTGDNWHRLLLDQMTSEVPGTRPFVISESTRAQLDEYRAFRHVARNIYAFNLDSAKVRHLVADVSFCFAEVRAELLAFAEFLDQ